MQTLESTTPSVNRPSSFEAHGTSAEVKKGIEQEIGYVLFIDTVGYSKLLIDEERDLIDTLNQLVHSTDEFRSAEAAGKLIKIPTGDGMALVFYNSPEAPVECALEISRALKEHPEFKLRMGVHSGPVSGVIDVDERANVAGAGINVARRVMDCGDAGHILLSQHVADDLEELGRWRPHLHDLGEVVVKHGVRVHLFNLYTGELGNPAVPEKVKVARVAAASHRKRAAFRWVSLGALALLAAVAVIAFLFVRYAPRFAATALAVPEKSIAVLPFENLSEDKENAYFAAGIQDEILTRLANLRELKVISHNSTEKYPSRPQNLKTVAADLGVATILEGSVQKLANEAHINVQLINALTGAHIWAQSYDRTLEHVFAVEGEVAQSVADALKVKLLPEQIEKLNALPTQNPKAYDLFLKGEYLRDRAWKSGRYEQDLNPAIRYFREAVALDPQFALAFARLAETQLTEYHFGLIDYSATRRPELLASAKENIDQALRLEPDLPAAHVALAHWHRLGKSDYDAAVREYKLALKADPQFYEAISGIAAIAMRQGRPREAINYYSKALEFDPRNPLLLRHLAINYRMDKDYARSAELLSRAVALDPTSEVDAISLSGAIITQNGDVVAALHILDAVPAELQNNPGMAELRAWLLTLRRDFAGAEKVVENAPAESWRSDWRRPLLLGEIQRALNQEQLARQSFEKSRALLLAAIAKDPEEPMTHADLALADAGIGRADEALREADRAIELQPVEKDALAGPRWLANRAEVSAQLGRTDEAIKLLERLLTIPNDVISVWELKLERRWDPLRDDPRFQKLIAVDARGSGN